MDGERTCRFALRKELLLCIDLRRMSGYLIDCKCLGNSAFLDEDYFERLPRNFFCLAFTPTFPIASAHPTKSPIRRRGLSTGGVRGCLLPADGGGSSAGARDPDER